MRYFATLPVHQCSIIDSGDSIFLVCLIDEGTLRKGLQLIDQEKEIARLKKELDELRAKFEEFKSQCLKKSLERQ